MGIADAQPHPEYAMLAKQFRALKTVCTGLERMLGEKGRDWRVDEAARKTLDSEREANAILTARVEALEERLRIWRDDYARKHGGALVTIPVHQIIALVGDNR